MHANLNGQPGLPAAASATSSTGQLFYGLAGYTQAHFDLPNSMNGDFDGWTAGAGFGTNLGGSWFLKGEYRFTALGDKTIYSCDNAYTDYTYNSRITDQADIQTGRLLLVYRLGSMGGLGGMAYEQPLK